MNNKAIRYLIYGQASFLLLISICFALRSNLFRDNASLSYYGNLRATIVPYVLSILVSDMFFIRTIKYLPTSKKELLTMRKALRNYLILSIGVLLTPFTINSYFFWAHLLIAGSLFMALVGFGAWLAFLVYPDFWNIFCFALLSVSTVTLFLSTGVVDVLHHLQGDSQLVAIFIFCIILTRTTVHLLQPNTT
jgi:hypothetical protein